MTKHQRALLEQAFLAIRVFCKSIDCSNCPFYTKSPSCIADSFLKVLEKEFANKRKGKNNDRPE